MFNAAGGELTKNALIREVFKLENQIPFGVLKQINGVNDNETQSDGQVDKDLGSNLENFCKQHCPFVNLHELSENPILGSYHHLLDLMYHLIVPDNQPQLQSRQQNDSASDQSQKQDDSVPDQSQQQDDSVNDQSQQKNDNSVSDQSQENHSVSEESQPNRSTCCYILAILVIVCVVFGIIVQLIMKLFLWVIRFMFRMVGKLLYSLFDLVLRLLQLLSGLLKYIKPALRWTHEVLSNTEEKFQHPLLKSLREGVEYLMNIAEADSADSDEGVGRTVMIPSVVELHKAGIQFRPAEKGISSIDFEADECVFYLPCIRLDSNSEVIIRNLVAYETLIKSNRPMIFTRYVELMRAVIDIPEDVKLLVDNDIIKSELKNEVITDLFNGMSKSIRPTNTRDLDQKIHQVNTKYYSNLKRDKMVTKYTSGSFLTAIGGFIFLVFTGLQTYCTVYNCSASRSSTFVQVLPQDGSYGRNNYFISSV